VVGNESAGRVLRMVIAERRRGGKGGGRPSKWPKILVYLRCDNTQILRAAHQNYL
jgi:hypothetical protein